MWLFPLGPSFGRIITRGSLFSWRHCMSMMPRLHIFMLGQRRWLKWGQLFNSRDHRPCRFSPLCHGRHESGRLLSLAHLGQIHKIIAQPVFPLIQSLLLSFKHFFSLALPLLVFFFLTLRAPMITRTFMSVMLIIPRTGVRGDLQTVITQFVVRRGFGSSSSTSDHLLQCQGHFTRGQSISWDI